MESGLNRKAAKLLVDITAHGHGHLSQTAPILKSLRRHRPNLRFVVRTGLAAEIVRQRLGDDVTLVHSDTDFGCVMKSPFEVDRGATLRRYLSVDKRLEETARQIADIARDHRCIGIFTNISYPAVLAASKLSIPSVACSSLIWSEVAEHYIGGMGRAAQNLLANMRAAYDRASILLRLLPGMPMARHVTVAVDRPIARVGQKRGEELKSLLGVARNVALVLCAFRGMLPPRPVALRTIPDLVLIGPEAWSPFVIDADTIDWPFEDLIASVDAVLTKPGYGIAAELGCNATPGVFVTRGDWPEESGLVEWLRMNGRCVVLPKLDGLDSASLAQIVRGMSSAQPIKTPCAGGEDVVARICHDFF
jgi:hypothetical protein